MLGERQLNSALMRVRRCHPPYISPKSYAKLSRSDAFSGLRIHTDEINEVIARIKSASLTIAVVRSTITFFVYNAFDIVANRIHK